MIYDGATTHFRHCLFPASFPVHQAEETVTWLVYFLLSDVSITSGQRGGRSMQAHRESTTYYLGTSHESMLFSKNIFKILHNIQLIAPTTTRKRPDRRSKKPRLSDTSKTAECSVTARCHHSAALFNTPSQTTLHGRRMKGGATSDRAEWNEA